MSGPLRDKRKQAAYDALYHYVSPAWVGHASDAVVQALESFYAAEIERITAERDRYRAALDTLDRMDPDDYRTGQDHLTPAFREVNFREAFLAACRVVDGALHGTDESGRPLVEKS